MSYKLQGTDVRAPDISTAVHFETMADRRELEILRSRLSDAERKEVREHAAADVLKSGAFKIDTPLQ